MCNVATQSTKTIIGKQVSLEIRKTHFVARVSEGHVNLYQASPLCSDDRNHSQWLWFVLGTVATSIFVTTILSCVV